jgi:Ca2+-binding EF-hand superfamily protein
MADNSGAISMAGPSNDPMPVTFHEERELRRVFDLLCDYPQKKPLKVELHNLQGQKESSKYRQPNAKASNGAMEAVTEYDERIQQLKDQIAQIEEKSSKKVTPSDVFEVMKGMNQKVSRKDVEEMIWECDEDLDGCLDWDEFKLMFTRNIMDKTGLEPMRMYNLVQFLIYDRNENGGVSVDEIMIWLYARYGKRMEGKIRELFGDNMHESGREGGELHFSDYVESQERVQLQTFWATPKGELEAAKMTGNKNKKRVDSL